MASEKQENKCTDDRLPRGPQATGDLNCQHKVKECVYHSAFRFSMNFKNEIGITKAEIFIGSFKRTKP